jgi:hypothetical protein
MEIGFVEINLYLKLPLDYRGNQRIHFGSIDRKYDVAVLNCEESVFEVSGYR